MMKLPKLKLKRKKKQKRYICEQCNKPLEFGMCFWCDT